MDSLQRLGQFARGTVFGIALGAYDAYSCSGVSKEDPICRVPDLDIRAPFPSVSV